MTGLFINPRAVLFCDSIDKQNGLRTIVCNPITEELLEINKVAYMILRQIEDRPGITRHELDDPSQIPFIDRMVQEGIVYEKES